MLRLLHLNIQGAVKFDDLVAYVKKNSFDIVHFQEVTGAFFSKSSHKDTFRALEEHLGYEGFFAKTFDIENEPESYFGNATFYKKSIEPLKKEVITIKQFASIPRFNVGEIDVLRHLPRNGIALLIEHERQPLWFINTHLAWGPNGEDEPEKIRQAEILRKYLDTLTQPYVLTGDFNVEKHTKVVEILSGDGTNYIVQDNITNTLSPQLHRAQHLFPKGLAVDFIITSKGVKAQDFSVIDDVLSDHLGLKITIV